MVTIRQRILVFLCVLYSISAPHSYTLTSVYHRNLLFTELNLRSLLLL